MLDRCAATFLRTGYEGSSIDDLVTASGLHRGSIYQAFGNKRGLFLAVLTRLVRGGIRSDDSIDLVLVALLELAPRDAEIRGLVGRILASAGPEGTAERLGGRLLERAELAGNPPPKEHQS